ncbi:hypothetical protein G9A89_000296 [Geosiphon pyriformis]|nr:hypothetical protein G9A89_000296 [Geosiphon pyriformis]
MVGRIRYLDCPGGAGSISFHYTEQHRFVLSPHLLVNLATCTSTEDPPIAVVCISCTGGHRATAILLQLSLPRAAVPIKWDPSKAITGPTGLEVTKVILMLATAMLLRMAIPLCTGINLNIIRVYKLVGVGDPILYRLGHPWSPYTSSKPVQRDPGGHSMESISARSKSVMVRAVCGGRARKRAGPGLDHYYKSYTCTPTEASALIQLPSNSSSYYYNYILTTHRHRIHVANRLLLMAVLLDDYHVSSNSTAVRQAEDTACLKAGYETTVTPLGQLSEHLIRGRVARYLFGGVGNLLYISSTGNLIIPRTGRLSPPYQRVKLPGRGELDWVSPYIGGTTGFQPYILTGYGRIERQDNKHTIQRVGPYATLHHEVLIATSRQRYYLQGARDLLYKPLDQTAITNRTNPSPQRGRVLLVRLLGNKPMGDYATLNWTPSASRVRDKDAWTIRLKGYNATPVGSNVRFLLSALSYGKDQYPAEVTRIASVQSDKGGSTSHPMNGY